MLMSSLVSVVMAATTCPSGQSITADTAGHCCWGGQVWSKMQRRCVGSPVCPAGTQAQGEACVIACPAGQVATEDTAGRCCWPNQVWAPSRNVCVGLPACPAGTVASGESCVAAAPSAQPPQYQPPPPQYQQQPPPPPQYPPPAQRAPPAQPQYTPPADAPAAEPGPTDVPTERTRLQGVLTGLRQEHASISVAPEIVFLAFGLPALPLGIWMFVTGVETDQIGLGILGLAITAASFTFDLISILSIPNKVRRRGNLTREIRATEAQLQALEGRARLLRPSGPLMFAFNSPVFTF